MIGQWLRSLWGWLGRKYAGYVAGSDTGSDEQERA